MSFTETLFGGLLIVVALYFLARRAGVPNYWSALLAGAIPFLAYLAYSYSHEVEGDVLTVHMVVFMATAGVLGVFANRRTNEDKLHWAPKLFMGFFAILVFIMALFLSISLHGLPAWVSRLIMPDTQHHEIHTEFSGVYQQNRNAD
ncbi:hypothetical protein GALL_314320 [mine drainage metagenome]|uniref:Uncharacterized protein n=1 Tax=mine drainage metagenome TaxID=410659 RepID=A0A1J5R408_9ZZZZ